MTQQERAREVMAGLPLDDLLDQYERFTNVRCRADEPHWLAGELRRRLDDFASGELRPLIAKFETATVDQLDRFAAATDALDSLQGPHHADCDAEATAMGEKNEAKAELVKLVSAFESLLKHIGLRESSQDLVELVQLVRRAAPKNGIARGPTSYGHVNELRRGLQVLRSDATMSGVMPRVKRLLDDPQQTPPLDWFVLCLCFALLCV
jgi:hypothetical protein